MKYLLGFNESKEELFSKINIEGYKESHYIKNISEERKDEIGNLCIKIITDSVVNLFPKIGTFEQKNINVSFRKTHGGIIIYPVVFSNNSELIPIKISIFEFEDNWFSIKFEYYDHEDESVYLCDDIIGLESCIKTIIK